MNHRELVLNASKKPKHHFLQLPEDLQDEVIDGLDGQKLTLQEASECVKSRGFSLSHEAVASYYRAVRRERRLYEAEQEFKRIAADFASQPLEEGAKSLANFMIALAHVGLADGSIKIKDIDMGKVLLALRPGESRQDAAPTGAGQDGKATAPNIPSAELIRQLREQLL
jgi:hypothetical protein